MTKKEELKQKRYADLMNRNSFMFADLFVQRLGLEKEEGTRFLAAGADNDEGDFYLNLNPQGESIKFDGYRYVMYDDIYLYRDRNDVKLFDPYNNIKLCEFLLNWYMINIAHYDMEDIMVIGLTNSRMNDYGCAFIKGITKGTSSNWSINGHYYTRDCIKYLDLIYAMENAFPLEYEKLKEVDIEPYDRFNG